MCGRKVAEKCLSEVFVIHVLTFLAEMEQAAKGIVPGVNWLSATKKELEEFVEDEAHEKLHLDVLANAHAHLEILKYTEWHTCELIVVGSHGHSGFVDSLLGSTAQKLMRLSKVPLMIVPEKEKHQAFAFQNILVPTDFSNAGLKAIRLGIQMAQSWGSTLHVLHIIDLKALWEMQKTAGYLIPRIGESLDVAPTIKKLLEQEGYSGESRLATLFGDPNEEILNYAEEHKIDFIVMGAHGRKGLNRVLIGSTTASVVRHASIPVISVCDAIPDQRR